MKSQILQCIANGDTQQAINLLLQMPPHMDTAILLSSSFRTLEANNRHGTVANSEYTIQLNRINQSIMNTIKDDEATAPAPPLVVVIDATSPITSLIGYVASIVKANERFDNDLYKTATDIRDRLNKYRLAKEGNGAYDRYGRVLHPIREDVVKLYMAVTEGKMDGVEGFANRGRELLGTGIPDYDKLKASYIHCTGRGFKDVWILEQLDLKQDSDDVRAGIADRIDAFLDSLI